MSTNTNNAPAAVEAAVEPAAVEQTTPETKPAAKRTPAKKTTTSKDSGLVLTSTGIKAKPAPKRAAAKTTTSKTSAKPAAKTTTKPAPKSEPKTTTKPAPKSEPKPRPSLSTKGEFVLIARKSRVSGTLVHLVNVEGKGSDMQPGKKGEKFARVCVDHKFADFHAKRTDAWKGSSDPTTWCPKCKKAAAAKSGN